ncbi:MAG: hypothetical protein CVU48_01645 [Candidatus Cloacimonetes bacterium HGW-Cloacimonetes-1]|jgi:hypothetical protein|nr:MAG: hypothetical protein CVU48_01645 [Candidatus Cloacimonetes bacterium HGW-Cloacimonetes-1]
MEKVIVYLSRYLESNEMSEYFHNQGFEALITDQRSTLLTAYSQETFAKVYLEISNFSDILLINSIKEINSDADIVLIVKPHLRDIIGVLQNNNYRVINNIMNGSSSYHNP